MSVATAALPIDPTFKTKVSKAGALMSITETELPSAEAFQPPHDSSRFLVSSPYTEQDHLLDLDTLDAENRLLALALTRMRNTRRDYSTAPYIESFNWTEVLDSLKSLAQTEGHEWKETSFYIVAFRSQIPPSTVYAELGALDERAHAEANASGGFLKYWFGEPNAEGRNLATCVWRSKEDARLGNVGPAHRKAANATRRLYTSWGIDRHRLIVRDDIKSWDIIDWVDE
ncbi:hypothetical protein MAPG_02829 [Magnaporthiopsis poae ATCC 64411]|uniref:Uncharacterized protein n=1 Tax=Magnaporthiopsis poae (strain ATCC 64411 / 73-15) TaxID=644358 RepID=A0A0C4DSF0_MAGP6|nr:hypothetical protein MAPG_02829 [Magnaporthiopsis poae ATCC 64411]